MLYRPVWSQDATYVIGDRSLIAPARAIRTLLTITVIAGCLGQMCAPSLPVGDEYNSYSAGEDPGTGLAYGTAEEALEFLSADEAAVYIEANKSALGTDKPSEVVAAWTPTTDPCRNAVLRQWQTAPIDPQSNAFMVEFDAKPLGSKIDGLIGLSQFAGTRFTAYATLVRFNVNGAMDVRNGKSYEAAVALRYTADTVYHIRQVVNVPASEYSVYVTPQGGSEQMLAENYSFRYEQAGVPQLASWGLYAQSSGLEVCNFAVKRLTIQASPSSGPAPLDVQFTAMVGGAAVSAADLPAGASLQWDYGDGTPPGSGMQVTHRYNVAGSYRVLLTIVLAGGLTLSGDQMTIDVSPPIIPTQAAARPTISPSGGSTVPVQVTLSCATPGANIRFTIDGSEPTGSSIAYTTPLTLPVPRAIKAKAFAAGYFESGVATAFFWQNASFAPQTGNFTAEFDATPVAVNMDGLVGLSSAAGTTFGDYAAMVRFNTSYAIDARNGGVYAADAAVNYVPGTVYHFRLAVNVPLRKYSVYVTPAGSTERLLASNYDFRTEQNTVTQLANWGYIADVGSLQASNFTVTATPSATFTISGRVTDSGGSALSGVTIGGLPGTPVTDTNGNYSAMVNAGFTGTATPSKTGYTFSPASRPYSNVTANQASQNYTATLRTFTISGRVADGAGTGISGVTISGLTGNPVTNSTGNYTATVNYGFSGTATPSRTGYTFSPASRPYGNVTANQATQNYTATLRTFTISGRVTDSSGAAISGVTINGLPGNPVTNSAGDYTATVNYGFTGTGTPNKVGYTFSSPASRAYSNVTANQASQNYTGAPVQTFTISGQATDSGGTAVSGVTIGGLPGNPVTDSTGNYTATVNYGFSGTATPSRTGYAFSPVSRSYSSVTANQASQNYTGTADTGGTYASSVSQWGITWTFDKAYRVGQFVTGDWWVAPVMTSGTVTVISITPARTGTGSGLRNGSMINAAGGPNAGNGYDGRTSDFIADLSIQAPLALMAGDSLLSSRSDQPEQNPHPDGWGEVATVAILTCVSQVPPADAFRPHYGVNNATKVIHRTAELHLDRLLSITPSSSPPNILSLERSFQRPWVDHFNGFMASSSAPRENLYSDRYGNHGYISYGRERGTVVGEAALMLLCDPAVVGNKQTLLCEFVQVGIDNYGLLINGHVFGTNGGHLTGRKLPILFAGYLLAHGGMLSIGYDYISRVDQTGYFQEDGQTAYVTQAAIDMNLDCELTGSVKLATPTTVTFDQDTKRHVVVGTVIEITSGVGAGQAREVSVMNEGTETATLVAPWNTVPNTSSTYRAWGFQQAQLGMAEWAGRFASGWKSQANPAWGHYYRTLNGQAWPGECLAVRLLGLVEQWNHPPFFDYVDRHMNLTAPNGRYPGDRSQSAWAARMWDTYR